jgi:hypothetical protein
MKLKMLTLLGIILTQMFALRGISFLPSLDQVSNAIGMGTDLVSDGYNVAEVIWNARNLINADHQVSPMMRKKLARLTLKINKNIKALVFLSRQAKQPGYNKKRLALNVAKTTEQIALYTKEFIITCRKP